MTDAPLYVILDFRLVPSLDATAARTFATLANSLYSRGIQVCSHEATNVSKEVNSLCSCAHPLQTVISGIQTIAVRSLLVAQGLILVHPDTNYLDRFGSTLSLPALSRASNTPDTILEQGLSNHLTAE